MLTTMQGLVEDAMYVSQAMIPMSTEGMLRISGARGILSYLASWSTIRCIGMPAVKIICKSINSKVMR